MVLGTGATEAALALVLRAGAETAAAGRRTDLAMRAGAGAAGNAPERRTVALLRVALRASASVDARLWDGGWTAVRGCVGARALGLRLRRAATSPRQASKQALR